MEGVEKLPLVRGGNADAAVPHAENAFAVPLPDRKIDGFSVLRVLDGIRKKIAQDMAQESLIAVCGRQRISVKADRAFSLSRGLDLGRKVLAKAGQIQSRGLEFQLSRFRPADE